jgi:WhiB family redox-sensing transcriptional regulator
MSRESNSAGPGVVPPGGSWWGEDLVTLTEAGPGIAPGWPATLDDHWTWHEAAACRDLDSAVFYSPEGERGPRKRRRERTAKAVCAVCPVLEVCAAYAIANREPYGTWGGMSENERRELLPGVDDRAALLDYRRALDRWEQRPRRRPG